MITTANLGLIVWDSEEDDFEHSQLANNFVRIDAHSHLGGLSEALNTKDELPGNGHWTNLGLGAAIKSEAIEPASIKRYLIKERAIGHKQIDLEGVESENIAEKNVLEPHLANEIVTDRTIKKETITIDKLDPNILSLGSVILWFKYSPAAKPGDLWHLCDGTAWASIPNSLGLTEGFIPDLRERFARGTDLNHTGEVGGNSFVDLEHHHNISSGSLSHTHIVGSHNHVISVDGKHNHTFAGGNEIRTRQNAFIQGLTLEGHQNLMESAYPGATQFNHDSERVPGGYDVPVPMDTGGEHNHGGNTGLSAAFATGGSSLVTTVETDTQLANVSTTPPFVGFCYIMRVL